MHSRSCKRNTCSAPRARCKRAKALQQHAGLARRNCQTVPDCRAVKTAGSHTLPLSRSLPPPSPPSPSLRWPPLREHSSRISLLYLLTSTHSFICCTFAPVHGEMGQIRRLDLLKSRPWIPPSLSPPSRWVFAPFFVCFRSPHSVPPFRDATPSVPRRR